MRNLQLKLDDRDFNQLVELGRAQIPTLAPEWTDHNLHDPGITFLELLAWTADAQIYALGRMRRDERLAYAALMGLRPRGPEPARGLVWLDKVDSDQSIPEGSVIRAQRPGALPFRSCHAVLACAARIERVSTRFAGGQVRQWPHALAASVPSFRPFGDVPAEGDCLVLELAGPLPVGGPRGADHETGHLSLGFAIEASSTMPLEQPTDSPRRPRLPRLEAFLEDDHGCQHLPIHHDGTDGLLHGGVIYLEPPARASTSDSRIVLRSGSGMLVRSPDVRRIALNVLEVEQVRAVDDVLPYPFGQGMPDQTHRIPDPPARLHPLGRPDEVRMNGRSGQMTWHYRHDLCECGPDDLAYGFDADSGTLRFGNGINGAMPPLGAQLVVRYRVTEGSRGALPAGVRWSVQGLTGGNLDPVSGGRDASTLDELRREARHAWLTGHPLVTAGDLEAAATAFADLGVSRARELPPSPDDGTTPTGTRRLIVVGRPEGPRPIVESAAWLEEIRERLAPRLPLGQRLEVSAPRYVPIRIRARLMCAPQVEPGAVAQNVRDTLKARLALLPRTAGGPAWPFGRAIHREDALGWLRACTDVSRVADLEILAGGQAVEVVPLGGAALPRYIDQDDDIQVVAPTFSGVRR